MDLMKQYWLHKLKQKYNIIEVNANTDDTECISKLYELLQLHEGVKSYCNSPLPKTASITKILFPTIIYYYIRLHDTFSQLYVDYSEDKRVVTCFAFLDIKGNHSLKEIVEYRQIYTQFNPQIQTESTTKLLNIAEDLFNNLRKTYNIIIQIIKHYSNGVSSLILNKYRFVVFKTSDYIYSKLYLEKECGIEYIIQRTDPRYSDEITFETIKKLFTTIVGEKH